MFSDIVLLNVSYEQNQCKINQRKISHNIIQHLKMILDT